MNGIKLAFSFVDLAKATGRGIGSVRLKDGSSVKILTDSSKNYATDFFHIKNGRLLGAYGTQGNVEDIAVKLDRIEKVKAPGEDAWNQYAKSFEVIA